MKRSETESSAPPKTDKKITPTTSTSSCTIALKNNFGIPISCTKNTITHGSWVGVPQATIAAGQIISFRANSNSKHGETIAFDVVYQQTNNPQSALNISVVMNGTKNTLGLYPTGGCALGEQGWVGFGTSDGAIITFGDGQTPDYPLLTCSVSVINNVNDSVSLSINSMTGSWTTAPPSTIDANSSGALAITNSGISSNLAFDITYTQSSNSNNWVQIVASMNGTTNKLNLYPNGSMAGEQSNWNPSPCRNESATVTLSGGS